MILVLCGTNRKNNKSSIISRYVYNHIKNNIKTEEVKHLSLENLPPTLNLHDIYDAEKMSTEWINIQEEYILPTTKWIVVSPEYNGTFPGILKLFIDIISMRKYKESFAGKKALLIGVAGGRAGNLRGMEQLTGFFNYLKIHVFPEKLPVSSVDSLINENGDIDNSTTTTIDDLVSRFIQG